MHDNLGFAVAIMVKPDLLADEHSRWWSYASHMSLLPQEPSFCAHIRRSIMRIIKTFAEEISIQYTRREVPRYLHPPLPRHYADTGVQVETIDRGLDTRNEPITRTAIY
jgi:hypothetical protein